jgi:hypothetical protein
MCWGVGILTGTVNTKIEFMEVHDAFIFLVEMSNSCLFQEKGL